MALPINQFGLAFTDLGNAALAVAALPVPAPPAAPAGHAAVLQAINNLTANMNQQFAAVNQQFATVNHHLGQIDGRLNLIDARLISATQTSARLHNYSCGDGVSRPYVPIPVAHANPPPARALSSISVIRSLTTVNANACRHAGFERALTHPHFRKISLNVCSYRVWTGLAHYGIQNGGLLPAKRQLLFNHIGPLDASLS